MEVRKQGIILPVKLWLEKVANSKSWWIALSCGVGISISSFFMLIFAVSFLAMPNTNAGQLNTTSSAVFADSYTLSISTPSSINLKLETSDADTMSVGQGNVNVKTNSPGYRLYLSMKNNTTDLNGSKYGSSRSIPGISGDTSSPKSLTRSTWGYAIPSDTAHLATNNFSTEYAEMNNDTPDDSKLFATPPSGSDLAQIIATSNIPTPDTGDNYPIYYGIRANVETISGKYSNDVLFTAIADAGTTENITITPNTANIGSIVNAKVNTTLYFTTDSIDMDIYLLTDSQYHSISGTDVEALGIPPLSCTKTTEIPISYNCDIAVPTNQGTYYIYAKIPRYDEVYVTEFIVVNPVTLTVNPNGGIWEDSYDVKVISQNEGTSRTIPDPSSGPTYVVYYDNNNQSATFSPSSEKVYRDFDSWILTGSGSFTDNTYIFGASDGTLIASYYTDALVTLPTITKPNHYCGWSSSPTGSAQYSAGDVVEITGDTTFYASCSLLPALVVNPNGGTWNGSADRQSFYQADGTTKSIANPTSMTHTISYDANGQDAAFTPSPSSATAEFANWTLAGGGTWNSSSKIYTFGSTNGTLTASYNNTSITLPSITKNNHTCKWAKDSASGTQYAGGAIVTINTNTTFYAVCNINPKLTVNPNGGTWNNSTVSQAFYQVAGTTKTINNPTGPSYTISYDANGQSASYTASPTSATRAFSSWTTSGGGSFSNGTYTFGTSNGALTASYGDATFTLPAIFKPNYTCKWAKGSASGTKYNGGSSVYISGDTTFYATCTATLHGISNMQEMTSAVCDNTTTPSTTTTSLDTNGSHIGDKNYVPTKSLKDTRNNTYYTVKKLADGNCWMTDNLEIKGTTLTSSDSDVLNTFTLPSYAVGAEIDTTYVYNDANYGIFYSWYAATAGSGTASMGTWENAPYSICPKGWKLPEWEEYYESSHIYNSRDVFARLATIPLSGERYYHKIRKEVVSLWENENGYLWTSTSEGNEVESPSSGSKRAFMIYGKNNEPSVLTAFSYNYIPVRCIAR